MQIVQCSDVFDVCTRFDVSIVPRTLRVRSEAKNINKNDSTHFHQVIRTYFKKKKKIAPVLKRVFYIYPILVVFPKIWYFLKQVRFLLFFFFYHRAWKFTEITVPHFSAECHSLSSSEREREREKYRAAVVLADHKSKNRTNQRRVRCISQPWPCWTSI